MKKIVLLGTTLLTLSFGANGGCLLSQSKNIEVTWQAYKTTAKTGVGGKFTSIEYEPASLNGKNFKELLLGSTVKIDKSKISTGNDGRDKRLVESFFNILGDKFITAKIVDIKATSKHEKGKAKEGVITAMVTMNGKSVKVPMKYTYKDGDFKATGTIDLFDFGAFKALKSINQACYDLHEGKTWNDVQIGFHTKIKATLCSSE